MKHEFFIQWDSTNSCNLRCKHCYHNYETAPTERMSDSEVYSMLQDLKNTAKRWDFVPAFNISGGEPLLRENLFDILDYSNELGIKNRILTNGTLIDDSLAKELSKRNLSGIQVSIDGSKEIHNKIRGYEWAYDKAMEGVYNASKYGIVVNTSCTLMQSNKDCLEDVIKESYEAGAKKVGFQSLVPNGPNDPEFISAFELYDIYNQLMGFSEKYKEKIKIIKSEVLWNAFLPKNEIKQLGEELDLFCGGCGAGFIGLSVISDGTVYPCRRLPIKIGHISEGIRKIFLESEVMNNLRDYHKIKECGECNNVTSCRGCRAIAYAIYGDYMAPDPMCFKKYIGGEKNGN